jgi:hypothetical protein
MMRLASLMLLLAAVPLSGACTTATVQTWPYDGEVPGTRAELYERFGPPAAIRVQEGNRWLRYDYAERKGMILGARAYGLGLILGRRTRADDVVWYGVDSEGRVVGAVPGRRTPELGYRLWPFGD